MNVKIKLKRRKVIDIQRSIYMVPLKKNKFLNFFVL